MTMTDIQIAHYDNDIPHFAEAELERLYGAVYSSLIHLRLHGSLSNASTYVARKGDNIVAIFLFRREKNCIRVLNEGMILGSEEVERFADYVFAIYDNISIIVFHSVQISLDSFARPYQCFACGEDIAATLPASVDAYIARLGAATRKNIRRHKHRIERTFPSFQFRIGVKEEVEEQHLREIISFNHARMAGKGRVSTIDEQRTQEILHLVRERGFVTLVLIDDRVCGGAITVRLGDTFASLVNAHDPHYDDYRLGTICCFLTICACIERGGKRFDFRWGQYEYKTALLGEHSDLYHLTVYRSRLHFAANGNTVLKTAMIGYWRAAKLQLLDMANRDRTQQDAPWIAKAISLLRDIKRWLVGSGVLWREIRSGRQPF